MDELTAEIAEMLNEGQVIEWFADAKIDVDYAWDGGLPDEHTVYIRANGRNYQFTIIESETQI